MRLVLVLKAVEALRESEERFRSLVQAIPECVYSALPDGEILYMSPAASAIFGYSAEELQKDKNLWIRLIHKDDQKELLINFQKLLKEGVPYIHEFRMRRKDENIVWIRDHANAVLDDKGKPVKITRIIYDITDRKRAEEALRRAYKQLEERGRERTAELARANQELQIEITERKQAEEVLLQHTKRVETLYAVAAAVSETIDVEHLLNNALAKVLDAMAADIGLVCLLDAAEKELLLKAHGVLAEEAVRQVSTIKLNEEELQKVLQWKAHNVPLSEIYSENNLGRIAEAMEKDKIQCFATVPISLRAKAHNRGT